MQCACILQANICYPDCGVESVVLTLSLVHSAGNLLTWQAGGVWEVLAGRLVVGASVHTVWEGMFVLLQENTRPSHRPATAALMNYSEWGCGGGLILTRHSLQLD